MEKLSRIALPLFYFLLLFSCTQNDLEPEVIVNPIDLGLLPFFQQFEEEAALRGIEVDLSSIGITGVIEDIDEDFVAGTCTYGTHLPGDVVIDLTFWNNSNNFTKEMVVFHELGHCYLRRDHLETRFSNGTCGSIMRSGTRNCFDNYNAQTRSFYIDELFFGGE